MLDPLLLMLRSAVVGRSLSGFGVFMSRTLSNTSFNTVFQDFESTAFRLEALDVYAVADEAVELGRFLSGEPLRRELNQGWSDLVRGATAAGKRVSRVHLVTLPLSAYIRFEIQWGYLYSSDAGESIHLMDREKWRSHSADEIGDFWLFDDELLFRMQYGPAGDFNGVIPEDDPSIVGRHRQYRDQLMTQAVPLRDYLINERTGKECL
jgi:hypothetical protein